VSAADGVTFLPVHQIRLPALIAASAMWASENNRTMMLATSGNRRGCRTVGLAAQWMMTLAGMSSGSDKT
jgi:hypothetical protein